METHSHHLIFEHDWQLKPRCFNKLVAVSLSLAQLTKTPQ